MLNMKLSQTIIDQLNYRIQEEQYSSRIYEQMSMFFQDKGLLNLAKVYDKYSHEELEHANWAKKFLLSFDIEPKLMPLAPPYDSFDFKTIKEVLDLTLDHEMEISRQCNELATLALKESNHLLYSLALNYCKEQIEEIEKAYDFLNIFELNDNQLIFDNYIGENYL